MKYGKIRDGADTSGKKRFAIRNGRGRAVVCLNFGRFKTLPLNDDLGPTFEVTRLYSKSRPD